MTVTHLAGDLNTREHTKFRLGGDGGTLVGVISEEAMNIGQYDYISMGYTGSNLTTVVFKTGGSGGTTVATLTLGYDGSNNLTSVTKS